MPTTRASDRTDHFAKTRGTPDNLRAYDDRRGHCGVGLSENMTTNLACNRAIHGPQPAR